jgi:hypothetical protein
MNPWISGKGTMQCCARGHCAPKGTADSCCKTKNPSDGKAIGCSARIADHAPQFAALPVSRQTYSVLLPQTAVQFLAPVRHPPPRQKTFPLPLLI